MDDFEDRRNVGEKKRDLSDESQLNTTNTLKKFKSSLPNRTSMASSTSLAASLSDGELTKKPKYNKKKPLTKPVDEPKKKRSYVKKKDKSTTDTSVANATVQKQNDESMNNDESVNDSAINASSQSSQSPQ